MNGPKTFVRSMAESDIRGFSAHCDSIDRNLPAEVDESLVDRISRSGRYETDACKLKRCTSLSLPGACQ